MQRGIVGIEAVDDHLDLGIDVVVIDWRNEHYHVGFEQVRVQGLHVVFVHTAVALVDASVATETTVQLVKGGVETIDLVTSLFCAGYEFVGQ